MKKIIFLSIILLTVQSAQSQVNNNIHLFPLNPSNIYVYKVVSSVNSNSQTYFRASKIIDSVTYDGRKYYKFVNLPRGQGFYRVDSVNACILALDSNNGCPLFDHERLLDSLGASPGDNITSCISSPYTLNCTGQDTGIFFNENRIHKHFEYKFNIFPHPSTYRWIYTTGIGLRYYTNYGSGPNFVYSSTYTLMGCVVNGVVYGDTTLVNVTQLGSEVPGNYSLHQNYPNPFNPSTKIKFDIPKGSLVKLKVYDMLGRDCL